jgi:hypothetical protein
LVKKEKGKTGLVKKREEVESLKLGVGLTKKMATPKLRSFEERVKEESSLAFE